MATFVLRSEVKSLEIMVADLFTGVQRLAQAVAVLSEKMGGEHRNGFVPKSSFDPFDLGKFQSGDPISEAFKVIDRGNLHRYNSEFESEALRMKLSIADQVQIYVHGLWEPLASEVRELCPKTLNEAMSMARGIALLKSAPQAGVYSKSEQKKEMESVQDELKKEMESGQNELKHVLGARANGEVNSEPTLPLMAEEAGLTGLQMAGQLQIWDPGPGAFYMIGVDVNAKSWEAYDPFRDVKLGFFSIQWDKIIEGEVLDVAGQEAYLSTLPWLNDGRSSLGSLCGMLRIENWIQRIAIGTHTSLEDIYNMWMNASRAILDGQSEGESFDLKHLSTRHGIAIVPHYYGISYSAELLNQVGVIVHGSCSKILITYSELKDQMSSASFVNMMTQESLVESGGINGLFDASYNDGAEGTVRSWMYWKRVEVISCLYFMFEYSGWKLHLPTHRFCPPPVRDKFSCSGWYARTRCLQWRRNVVDLFLTQVEAHATSPID